ncbi:Gfo/Idh/MocA family protein [Paenibacillus ginsengarvi]|uniref:Gfo/Idh/MocA family oxidoreductase n=1 Tax=Paenibacillus ginsengarvi TaxID=400777 RepID=A0A3B0BUR7_9BACL|nr:Gfo/Idh/MocA family oxidoreductase [Paenibacillus ginsengarvi]RKN75994.1 gfo/Idh/MocA family oxidoreductase [Paenibacillus ginsengarvi]
MNKVRIGFIGVGGMAEHHIKTLQKLDNAELTAVFDINAERAKQISDSYGPEVFASEQELLDSGKIDAVFLCTPPFARGLIEEQIAARGIHLLSEKPVGLDMDTARRVSKAITASGIINSSGYCLRYLENVQKAKSYLEGKQVNMVLSYRIGGLPGAKWWAQLDKSGGQIIEQATHQIDLIRYLAGDFAETQSFYAQRTIQTINPEATIPDVGVVAFTMQSGAVGSFVNTCMSPHFGRGDVEFIGADFYLAIKGSSITIHDAGQKQTDKCETDFYLEQDRAFIEAVRTGRQELVLGSFADAVDTLEATINFGEINFTKPSVTA